MKKMRLLSCIAMMALMFTACKKDDAGNNNNNQGDYFPKTAGSTFTYVVYDSSTASSSTVTYTVIKDTTIYGKTYTKSTGSDTSEIYQAKSGSSYYQLFSIQGLAINNVEQLYLKDDQATGATWTQAVSFPNPLDPTTTLSANFGYTIADKGSSMTIDTNTFNDVIHVRMTVKISGSYTPPGIPFPLPIDLDLGGGDFYYARGAGMIKTLMNIEDRTNNPLIPAGLIPEVKYSQTLTAYTIK